MTGCSFCDCGFSWAKEGHWCMVIFLFCIPQLDVHDLFLFKACKKDPPAKICRCNIFLLACKRTLMLTLLNVYCLHFLFQSWCILSIRDIGYRYAMRPTFLYLLFLSYIECLIILGPTIASIFCERKETITRLISFQINHLTEHMVNALYPS